MRMSAGVIVQQTEEEKDENNAFINHLLPSSPAQSNT